MNDIQKLTTKKSKLGFFGSWAKHSAEQKLVKKLMNGEHNMMEYFKSKEEGLPGKLHVVLHLTDEFIEDVMSGIEPEKYKELIVDIFAAEYDAWVMREKAK